MTDREFLAKAHIEPFETPAPGPTPHPAALAKRGVYPEGRVWPVETEELGHS